LYSRQLTFRQRPRLIPVGDIQASRHGSMKRFRGTEIRGARIAIGGLFVETIVGRDVAECGFKGDVGREKGVTRASMGLCGHFREYLTWTNNRGEMALEGSDGGGYHAAMIKSRFRV
jgi:hypothetical protein